MGEPVDQDAMGLASCIHSGELSAREACLASIRRIEAANETLNAVVAERFDEALEEIDRGLPDGPLRGVPILVKDLDADVAGLPSINGSRLFAEHRAGSDSELVARYRRAGMVVLGKTNTPEFGKSPSTEPVLFGPTHNPWESSHSPGGSSGGSAAAVAAGLVPVAHGTDGGGSIRIPSAACGLFGLKPTRGRTPGAPYRAHMANPLSVHHALTTSVRDSATLLDVASGQDRFVAALGERPQQRLRIGYTTAGPGGIEVDPECRAAVQRAAGACAELGHELVEAAPEYDATGATLACVSLMRAALVATIDDRLAELGRDLREDDIEAFTRVMYEQGRQMSAAELVRALHTAERVSGAVTAWFDDYDLLLTPTLAARTPALGTLDTTRPERMYAESGSYNAFTGVYNLTGHPAMSVPFGHDQNGLPLGVQFVAGHEDEALLLRLAASIERSTPWPRNIPALPVTGNEPIHAP